MAPESKEAQSTFNLRMRETGIKLSQKDFLLIPTYDQGFQHITRIGFKGFMEHAAQLNENVLALTARKIFECAWVDLVNENFSEWYTEHSVEVKAVALKQNLDQINDSDTFNHCFYRSGKVAVDYELQSRENIALGPFTVMKSPSNHSPSLHPVHMFTRVPFEPPALLTPEERTTIYDEEAKEAQRLKRKAYNDGKKKEMTPEELKAKRRRHKEWYLRRKAAMGPEVMAAERAKRKARMTPEAIEAARVKRREKAAIARKAKALEQGVLQAFEEEEEILEDEDELLEEELLEEDYDAMGVDGNNSFDEE